MRNDIMNLGGALICVRNKSTPIWKKKTKEFFFVNLSVHSFACIYQKFKKSKFVLQMFTPTGDYLGIRIHKIKTATILYFWHYAYSLELC